MSNHLQVVEQQKPTATKQQQPGMIMPAGTVDQALEAFNQYQELKKKLGNNEDFQAIKTKEGVKYHPKKSFVRKVQRFFNVSCEIIQDEPLTDPKTGRIIAWLAKARAVHLATGAYQEADGSCGLDEKAAKQQTIHNIRAHAITRAKNRAILDLVGFGEVSAEELNERAYQQPARQQTQQTSSNLATIKQKKAIYAKAKEKGLNDEQVKKLVHYHLQRETNNMTKQEASDLIKLVEGMNGKDLLNLIGEKAIDAEVIDINPEEVEEIINDRMDG